jgi:membrane-associated protease RseP (regulator of RpoE activity)
MERDGRRITRTVTPVLSEVEGERVARLGVILSAGSVLERDRAGPIEAVGQAGQGVGRLVTGSFRAMGQVFGPEGLARIGRQLVGEEPRRVTDPAGLVGVARVAGQAAEAGFLEALLELFAGFNVFVGVLNLLPLPPLDGGHLAVVAVEKVTGRRVDARKLLPLTAVVVVFLLLFFISLLYLDLTRPLPNPFR